MVTFQIRIKAHKLLQNIKHLEGQLVYTFLQFCSPSDPSKYLLQAFKIILEDLRILQSCQGLRESWR